MNAQSSCVSDDMQCGKLMSVLTPIIFHLLLTDTIQTRRVDGNEIR